MSDVMYFDYAAATPLDPSVQAAMAPYFNGRFFNPSALYLASKAVHQDVEAARQTVAQALGARPGEIFFTSGGTEANNLAIQGVMRQYPHSNVVVSAIEHESVLEPAKLYNAKLAPVKPDGIVDVEKLAALIDDETVLVGVMYANNEVGSIQPIADVAKVIQKVRQTRRQKGNDTPLYLHTDACQAAAYLLLQVNRLGVDLLTLNAGKIYGPKGCGALYVQANVKLAPLNRGGGQENGLRSGTENVPGIIGFAKALEVVQARRQSEVERLKVLQKRVFDRLETELPQVVINGSRKHRLPNNLHITVLGIDNERLLMELDEQGIQCATGSACTASNEDPSHVLLAMGLSPEDARASLRFTMGIGTTEAHVDTLAQALIDRFKA